MNAKLPSAPSEASTEASKSTPTEGGVSADAKQEGQQRQIDADLAEVEQRVNEGTAERTMQEGADTDQYKDIETDSDKTEDKSKSGWAGFASSLSAGWGSISKWLSDAGGKVGDWIRDLMGIEKGKESGTDSDEDEDTDSDFALDTDLDAGDPIDPDKKIPDDVSSWVKVKSWGEVTAIPDLGQRIVQAALYAYATGLDCFTKDGNHCSAWCDSVFAKAGLGTVYNDDARIYSNYKTWPKKGTMQGLELQPGDSLIRYSETAATGYHQEIVLSSKGPDSAGNYKVVTVGQTSVHGSSGTRKIRSLTIKSSDIKVVVRPGATKPWDGAGTNLIA